MIRNSRLAFATADLLLQREAKAQREVQLAPVLPAQRHEVLAAGEALRVQVPPQRGVFVFFLSNAWSKMLLPLLHHKITMNPCQSRDEP